MKISTLASKCMMHMHLAVYKTVYFMTHLCFIYNYNFSARCLGKWM